MRFGISPSPPKKFGDEHIAPLCVPHSSSSSLSNHLCESIFVDFRGRLRFRSHQGGRIPHFHIPILFVRLLIHTVPLSILVSLFDLHIPRANLLSFPRLPLRLQPIHRL